MEFSSSDELFRKNTSIRPQFQSLTEQLHSVQFYTMNVRLPRGQLLPFQGAVLFGKTHECEVLRIIPPVPTQELLFQEMQNIKQHLVRERLIFTQFSKDDLMDNLQSFCQQGLPLVRVFSPEVARLEGLTPFQLAVYREACSIPHGETQPYSWLAHKLKKYSNGRTAARAVGGAMKKNPFPLYIPCHRVVAKNGTIGGFMGAVGDGAWQIGLKKTLLSLENLYRQPDLFSQEIMFQSLLA